MAGHVRVSHRTKALPKARRRWEVSYVDPLTTRRRTKGGFTTKGAADDWLLAFNHHRREGRYVDDRDGAVVFKDAAREWLDSRHRLKIRTRESYERILFGERSPLALAFGSASVRAITYDDVVTWVSKQAAEGKAPTTIRNAFFVLQAILKEQVHRRRITGNPCAGVELPPVRKAKDDDDDEQHYLTPAEVEALAGAMPAEYRLYVRLAAYTGMRAGELAGLQVRDIDVDAATIRVRRQVVDALGGLRYDDPKRPQSRRVLGIDAALAADLKAYLRAHRAAAQAWFAERPDDAHPGDRLPLFVGSASGGRTTGTIRLDYSRLHNHAQWYSTHWHRTVRKAGLASSITFHDLRHTCASWLIQDGVSFKEVQEQMGHASIGITLDRYAHLDRQRSRDNVRRAMAARRAGAVDNTVVPLWKSG
jgi:integrase